MYLKNIFATILGVFFALNLVAQDFDNYQLLKSTGTIPKDFLIPSSEKYKQEIENIDKEASKTAQKDEKQFYLESNFLIDDLLQSARVLFNDPISEYINKVADELLKDDREMRQKLRFYAIRSSAVNAFATNQGIIFVNVGLLAQLESEAQLAFILAHEICHVRHGHALNMFLETQRISRYTSTQELMKKTSFDDKMVATNYFSKELETHADKEGLTLYLKSKYSLEDLDGVFDVLQYAYLPFDIVPFKRDFFENEFIKLPDDYFLKDEELLGIDGEYEEDDSKSTHPNISKRRIACTEAIATENKAGRQHFIIGTEAEFLKIRDIARFELAYYYLHHGQFQEAIYACYILKEKYPNSHYLANILSKALYGYAKFKNELAGIKPYSVTYSDSDMDGSMMSRGLYKTIEGPSQQIYYCLEKLKPKEATVLALRHVWDAAEKYPNDKEIQDIRKDLFLELTYHYEKPSEFASRTLKEAEDEKKLQDSLAKLAVADTTTANTKLSKYDKIKKQKEEEEAKPVPTTPEEFTKYAFRDIVNSNKFKDLFADGEKERERRKKRDEYYQSSEGRAYLNKKRKRNATALGIDSVLVYMPYYLKVSESNEKVKVDYLKSEKNQIQLTDFVQQNAKMAKVHAKVLNVNALTESDADAFNELRVLAEWMSQQNLFGNNLLMKGFNQDMIDAIIQKYGMKYLLFTGVVSIQKSRSSFALWSVLFDLESGRYQVIKDDFFSQKDHKNVLNAHLFDVFFQLKSKYKG